MTPPGLPPEILAAMAGGAAPQPAAGGDPSMGGIPPEILAMADQIATQQTDAAMGPAEAQPQGSPYGGSSGGEFEPLREALDALQEFVQESSDEEKIQVVLKCITTLQKVIAVDAKAKTVG